MSELIDNNYRHDNKRPVSLLVVSILSFLYMSYTLINSFLSLARGPLTEDQLLDVKVEFTKSINEIRESGGMNSVEDMLREMIYMTEVLNDNFMLNVVSSIVFVVIGSVGVWFMLRGKKWGFHAYIIYSFLSSVQIYLFMQPSMLTNTMVILNLLISGIFVLIYSKSLKWMQ